MLRRHWGILLAVAGLALGHPIDQRADAQTRPAENQAKAAENDPARSSAAIQNNINRIASAMEAAQADPNAQRSEQRAQNDLKAQQDMAKWAMWMFFVAAVTTLLSALGVFLIWRTLHHTREASKYAGIMAADGALVVAETVKANNEMREANQIAQAAAEAERRPWILIESLKVHSFSAAAHTTKHPLICLQGEVTLRNVGATPATVVILSWKFFRLERDDIQRVSHIPEGGAGYPTALLDVIAPADFKPFAITVADQLDNTLVKPGFLHLMLTVSYRSTGSPVVKETSQYWRISKDIRDSQPIAFQPGDIMAGRQIECKTMVVRTTIMT